MTQYLNVPLSAANLLDKVDISLYFSEISGALLRK